MATFVPTKASNFSLFTSLLIHYAAPIVTPLSALYLGFFLLTLLPTSSLNLDSRAHPLLKTHLHQPNTRKMYQLRRFATAMLRLAKMDATGEAAKGPASLAATVTAPSDPKDKANLTSQQNGDGKQKGDGKQNGGGQKGSVKDFQRLCVNLGLPGELGSKTKCRKVCQSQTRKKGIDINLC